MACLRESPAGWAAGGVCFVAPPASWHRCAARGAAAYAPTRHVPLKARALIGHLAAAGPAQWL